MIDSTISRRTLAKGAAWTIPAVTVAAASPAAAVSGQPPALKVAGRVTWNEEWYTEDIDNYQNFKVFSTGGGGSTVPGSGYCVSNTTTSTVITNFTATFYLPYESGLTFVAGPGGQGGWSTLRRDTSKTSKRYNGVTYYAYTTTYTGTIKAAGGQTCLPGFQFESPDNVDSTGYFFVDNSAVVDKNLLTANYGPISMS